MEWNVNVIFFCVCLWNMIHSFTTFTVLLPRSDFFSFYFMNGTYFFFGVDAAHTHTHRFSNKNSRDLILLD